MANTTLGHTARRTLLFTERHDRRTLVETRRLRVGDRASIQRTLTPRARAPERRPGSPVHAAAGLAARRRRSAAAGARDRRRLVGGRNRRGGLGRSAPPSRSASSAPTSEIRLLREIDSEALLNPARCGPRRSIGRMDGAPVSGREHLGFPPIELSARSRRSLFGCASSPAESRSRRPPRARRVAGSTARTASSWPRWAGSV